MCEDILPRLNRTMCIGTMLLAALKFAFVVYLLLKLYIMCTIERCKSKKRMDGKVVIITGANSGEC